MARSALSLPVTFALVLLPPTLRAETKARYAGRAGGSERVEPDPAGAWLDDRANTNASEQSPETDSLLDLPGRVLHLPVAPSDMAKIAR